MKKYKVTFLTGWAGMPSDMEEEKIIEAEDFEDAFHKGKEIEWNPDVHAEIVGIEELKENDVDNSWENW